jgi:NADPH:quinone reductase-like Zn-dependent oxidoreductase
MDFLLAKDDLHRCRFDDRPSPEPGAGQALLRIDAFGLTSNNITYATFGEAMSYWSFFPAEDGWGRMPVWGFAEVLSSAVAELEPGTRVYGYLPPSSELLVTPSRAGAHGFIDAAAHRAQLPAAYNRYARVDGDPMYDARHEDEQMLLRPLFLTSYLIDDFLEDADFFAADTVVLSSASSKTASALAFLLAQRDGIDVVGLTSARSAEFARALGVYDHVVAYDELESLPDGRAVYVDMAGDAQLRGAVHNHYREQLAHSAVVGATHHDRMGAVPDSLPGPRPTFFFAPDRVAKRSADWGAAELERRMGDAWRPYVQWTAGWLKVAHSRGADALRSAYLDLLDGRIDPASAHVLSLPR